MRAGNTAYSFKENKVTEDRRKQSTADVCSSLYSSLQDRREFKVLERGAEINPPKVNDGQE